MRGKGNKIVLPGEETGLQLSLFPATGTKRAEDSLPFDPFPTVLRDEVGFGAVIATTLNGGGRALGLDFEFNPRNGKPSITGIASRKPLACAVPWDIAQARHLVDFSLKNDIKLVGHNSVATEKTLLEKNLDCDLPLSLFEDSMLEHFLLNQDFVKTTEKSEDEGSYGFMGLWPMSSMYTDLSVWKTCRGRACEGPCPRHDVWSYCAIDSYASVEGHFVMREEMKRWKLPYSFYREYVELAEICEQMEKNGLRIDLQRVDVLNKEMEEAKEKLFPHEIVNKVRQYEMFNPRSGDQVKDWFNQYGMHFKTVDKAYIQKVLEKQGVKAGFSDFEAYKEHLQDHPPSKPPLKQLYDLYQFKTAGKGLDSWYGEKYLTGDMINPRFVTTGSSMNRLSSSRPNFQNIPVRGWGKKIKSCVIPRDPDMDFLETDLSQMELRACLYLAGVDPSTIGDDAFTYLVQQGDGAFEKAQSLMPGLSARDVAKSVSHACLTGDHEILTPTGWVALADFKEGTEIAEWSGGTENIKFRKPKSFFGYAKPAELHSLEGRGISALCTKNHNFPIVIRGTWEDKKYAKLRNERADSLSISGNIPICGNLVSDCSNSYTDDEIRKVVAIQADGSFRSKYPYYVKFNFARERKQKRFEELFGKDTERPSSWKPKINRKPVKTYIVRFQSDLLNTKKEFTDKLLTLTTAQRKVFLDELLYWDGSQIGTRKCYFSTSLICAQWVQTMAHLTGHQALLRINKPSGTRKFLYEVSFNKRKFAAIETLTQKTVEGTGRVYCFETTSGYFLVRRNNKIFVSGNSNYLEGLKIIDYADMETARTKREIADGCLRVHPDWEFRGGIVCFTGANLAERFFGSKTDANRKKALEIQDIYFTRFPMIRTWHKTVLSAIEDSGYVQDSTGRFLRLYGSREDDCKHAAAFYGQGTGAIHVQGIMIRYKREQTVLADLQCHDSLLFEIPKSWADSKAYDFLQPMFQETWRYPGFRAPGKARRGKNYGDMVPLVI